MRCAILFLVCTATAVNAGHGFEDKLFRSADVPGRYSVRLMDQCISAYSHGAFSTAREFVHSISTGLDQMIPVDLYEYRSDIDYFVQSDSNKPQPGARVRLWTSSSNDGDASDLLVDLLFGCDGQQYDGSMLQHLELSEYDLTRYQQGKACIPFVTIEHVRIDGKVLRSRGFTSNLLLNIINTMDIIRRTGKLPQPPRIAAYALTHPGRGYTGAAFWARQGFRFRDEQERIRLINSFADWMRWNVFSDGRPMSTDKWMDLRSSLTDSVQSPSDLIHSDQWAEHGKRFLSTSQHASWHGHLLVTDEDDHSRSMMQRLRSNLRAKRYQNKPPTINNVLTLRRPQLRPFKLTV